MLRFLLFSFVLAAPVLGQPQQTLFPGQTGAELRASLVAAYRPATVLSEAQAKDRMYDTVDRDTVGGEVGVVGVYTGFFVPFDCQPSCDPSQDVFNNGAGLNAEHTWPRSEGTDTGNAEWDLHHLFPTRVNVNGDRGNLPFAENPDALTTRWYRGATSQTTTPPDSIIDQFSELRQNLAFEPRETHEGDVARAMFYIATMYAGQVSMSFFDPQQETLFAWHRLDPVDEKEYGRTQRIAPFQDDKPNPFVLDSTLVRRAFFPDIPTANEVPTEERVHLSAPVPNPSRQEATLTVALTHPGDARVEVFDALGRRVSVLHAGLLPAVPHRLRLDRAALPPGFYVVRLTAEGVRATQRLIRLP